MTFEQFPLLFAIHKAFGALDSPRSDAWITTNKDRLCHVITGFLPAQCLGKFTAEQIVSLWLEYGKCPNATDSDFKKLALVVLVADQYSQKCFWASRVETPCSPDVSLDRLVPGGPYIPANCVISCGSHNSQRNNREVGDFLRCTLTR